LVAETDLRRKLFDSTAEVGDLRGTFGAPVRPISYGVVILPVKTGTWKE